MEETQRKLGGRGTLFDLPRDIIQKILLQFSVKDLLKLKSVSKSLCSLISSESFVKAHLLKSSKDTSYTHFKIATSDVCEPWHRNSFYFYYSRKQLTVPDADRALRRWERRCLPAYLLREGLLNSHDFHGGRLERRERDSNTVRYCNGLLCDVSIDGKDFTLRNPSTRKRKKLPPVNFGKGIYGSAISCGFGYVESNNDYKVFALSLHRKVNGVYHCIAKVYSLKMDCWRIVDDNYKLETPMDLTARYLCGMLYWLRMFRNKKNRLSWEIISFDLEKEAFGITVQQPDELEGSLYTPQLAVFNGSLCVVCIYSVFRIMDIWVLKQHAPSSWTKVPIFPDAYSSSGANVLAVTTDGMIFRDAEPIGLIYYLPNEMCRRNLRIVDLDMFDKVCVYVESLVSLGNSEEAGVSGSMIDFEFDKRRVDDLDSDDDGGGGNAGPGLC